MSTITEIYDAIKDDDTATVEAYLQDIDPVTIHQIEKLDNLLQFAIRFDKLDMVKLLVSYNANPEVYCQMGLFYATSNYGSKEMVDYLIGNTITDSSTDC